MSDGAGSNCLRQVWRIWWVRDVVRIRNFECSQCLRWRVRRCIVLVKQHPVTQLCSSFLFHFRPSFSDQISVEDSCDGAAMFKIVNQYNSLSISEYNRHNFASRRDNAKLFGKWGEETCFHLLTRHLKHWLSSKMSDSNYSLSHHIRRTWPKATFICFLNWKNSWNDTNLRCRKFADDEDVNSAARQMAGWKTKITILLQWNPSFGETLDQVRFSWRRLCRKVTTVWLTMSGYERFERPS